VALYATSACGDEAARRGATVMFASGADLQSINPLLTNHPLARQVQRYVLLTTLARYDSSLVPRPYLARAWRWSADHHTLTFELRTDVRWHDGTLTTARDVVWTLDAARDPATGYPRYAELQTLASVTAPDDATVELRFARRIEAFPFVLTDLAILPAHLLDSVPHARLRESACDRSDPLFLRENRFDRRTQLRIFSARHDGVDGSDTDVPPAAGGHCRVNPVERALVVGESERDAQHVDGGRPRGQGRGASLVGSRGRHGHEGGA